MDILNFGKTINAAETKLYCMKNKNGMEVRVTDFGATLVSALVPDKEGNLCDVVLGYDSAEAYEKGDVFFGATVGRNANRIGGAAFEINGVLYELEKNDGENNLHSGCDFYNKRIWQVTGQEENAVTFSLESPDGDQGYPGEAKISVTYTLTEENEIVIKYEGSVSEDTVMNFTNHSYFNLDGHASGDVLEQKVWINADAFTPYEKGAIPTGEIRALDGTPMDFREKKAIGQDIEAEYEALVLGAGYDHNYVLNGAGTYRKAAEMEAAVSGITMEVYTDLPGMQLYTANFVHHEKGKDGGYYERRQAACFETQYFPDAVNKKEFESPVLGAGECYKTTTVYKFGVR